MNKNIVQMGLEGIPEPFRKYSECAYDTKKSHGTGDMLFMLLIALILFDF